MIEDTSKIVSLVRDGVIRKTYKTVQYLDAAGQVLQMPRDIELSDDERIAHYGAAQVEALAALEARENDLRKKDEEILALTDGITSRDAKLSVAASRIDELERDLAAARAAAKADV